MSSETTSASNPATRARLNAALSKLKQTAWKQKSQLQLWSTLWRTRGQFKQLPSTREGKPRDSGDITAACILDDFSFRAFEDEMHLVPVKPDAWYEAFVRPVDLLLVEAFWRGSGGSWKGIAYDYNIKERELLKKIVRWCRDGGIPTVFWNKEDPSHFSEFIDIAAEFDHVLTTDSGCIPRYAQRGKQAEVMQFAAQPSLHNPVEIYPERTDKVCFAGSYIRIYSQRMRDFEALADAVQEVGLDIYDRNLERNDERYHFPAKYGPMIKGTLKGDEILRAYKGYRYGLNMNSIKGSETMLARRVFELMACNTPVISNASRAIDCAFPGLVLSSDDPAVIKEGLRDLRSDETRYRIRRALALREVMQNHTYRDRAGQISKIAFGVEARPKHRHMVCVTTDGGIESIRHCFNAQTFTDKELRVVGTEEDLERLIDECASRGQVFSLMRQGDHYGPNYLLDASLAFYYSGAAVITKLSHYRGGRLVNDGHQYRWVDEVAGGALLIDSSKLSREAAVSLLNGLTKASECKCLSIDEFNYEEGHQPEGNGLSIDI